MRKTQKLMRILSLALVLSLCFGLLATSGLKLTAKAAGTTVEFTASDFAGKGTANTGSEVSVTKGGVTVEANKAYGADSELRIYAPSSGGVSELKISVASGNISKIEITCTKAVGADKQSPDWLEGDGYTASGKVGTWSGSASSVTLSASKQVRATSIVVTLGEGGTVDPVDPPVDPVDPPVDPVDPKTTSIADALKAKDEATVTNVTGVVTFFEVSGGGLNVYIQDAKAENGICVRIDTTEHTYKIGDVIVVEESKRDTYNGLPQLVASATKVKRSDEKIELKTNEVTIDKVTEAMICTYVHITDLEVTKVDDNNGKYANPNVDVKDKNGKTIQIYKAILGETEVKVGDKVDFTGAVGFFVKTDKETGEEVSRTLQLRNTLATEIKVTPGTTEPDPSETPDPSVTPEPSDTPDPTDKPAETKGDTFVLGTEVKDGDKVILVNVANSLAINATTVEGGGKTYLTGTKVNPQSSKITTDNADIVWTVKVVDGGYKLVNAKGETISCTNGLAYGDTDNVWAFEFDGKTLKIKSTTAKGSSGDPKYIEWFEKYSQFSTYYLKNSKGEDNDPALFAMNMYVLDPEATAVKPSGNPGTADNAQLVLAGVVMVMAVAAAAAVVAQRKKSF